MVVQWQDRGLCFGRVAGLGAGGGAGKFRLRAGAATVWLPTRQLLGSRRGSPLVQVARGVEGRGASGVWRGPRIGARCCGSVLARDVVLGEKACLGRRVTRHPPDLTREEKELGSLTRATVAREGPSSCDDHIGWTRAGGVVGDSLVHAEPPPSSRLECKLQRASAQSLTADGLTSYCPRRELLLNSRRGRAGVVAVGGGGGKGAGVRGRAGRVRARQDHRGKEEVTGTSRRRQQAQKEWSRTSMARAARRARGATRTKSRGASQTQTLTHTSRTRRPRSGAQPP